MENKLIQWAIANEPSDDMIYKKAFWRHIRFTRDTVIRMFYDSNRNVGYGDEYNEYYKKQQEKYDITGTHTSKSIKFPVVTIYYKGSLITMRCNFHDWNVSVISDVEINIDSKLKLFNEDKCDCFFQGFKDEHMVKTPYSESKLKFSCRICNDYEMYMFLRLVKRRLDWGKW